MTTCLAYWWTTLLGREEPAGNDTMRLTLEQRYACNRRMRALIQKCAANADISQVYAMEQMLSVRPRLYRLRELGMHVIWPRFGSFRYI